MKKINRVDNPGENTGTMVGDNSNGVVIVNNGVPFDQLEPYLHALVARDLERYTSEARLEANRRNDEFICAFISSLKSEGLIDDDTLSVFKEPSMQLDFQEAQKGFIRSGTEELKNRLTDILLRRIRCKDNELLKIVLSESITVASKLLTSQIAILGLSFACYYSRKRISNVEDFIVYCNTEIIPLLDLVGKKLSDYNHLNFTGCSQSTVLRKEIEKTFAASYIGLFAKGFSKQDSPIGSDGVPLITRYPFMFSRCFTNPDLFQIRIIDKETFDKTLVLRGIAPEDVVIFKDAYFNQQKMEPADVKQYILKWVPDMQRLFDYWDNNSIRFMTLTSVGMAIGCMFVESITKEKFDLGIWI